MFSHLASFIFRCVGWRSVFTPPPGPKTVIMVYPHTSNWDFPLGLLFKAKHRLPIRWAGKDSLFRWPLRGLFVWLGGIPINRRERTGVIGQLVEEIRRSPQAFICIAPEGTRSKTDHLKTGFYRLALEAGVPLGLAFIDYRSKTVGIGRWITLSGNQAEDVAVFRDFYADKVARYPEKAGEICFKD